MPGLAYPNKLSNDEEQSEQDRARILVQFVNFGTTNDLPITALVTYLIVSTSTF